MTRVSQRKPRVGNPYDAKSTGFAQPYQVYWDRSREARRQADALRKAMGATSDNPHVLARKAAVQELLSEIWQRWGDAAYRSEKRPAALAEAQALVPRAQYFQQQSKLAENLPASRELKATLISAVPDRTVMYTEQVRVPDFHLGDGPLPAAVTDSRSPEFRGEINAEQGLKLIENAQQALVRGGARSQQVSFRPDAQNDQRPLSEYKKKLGPDFEQALKALGPNQRWLDVGTDLKALREYLGDAQSARSKAHVTGVDLVPRDLSAARAEVGDRIDFEPGNIRNVDLKPGFDLVTDVFAALSYDPHPDQALQRELELLRPGGSLFTLVLTKQNQVVSQDGKLEPLTDWLSRIPGIRVTYDPKKYAGDGLAVRLEKLSEHVQVPKLELVAQQDGTPPFRVFEQPEVVKEGTLQK